MTKILFYEPSSGYGGSSSNLYHILRKLDRGRWDPVVLHHQDGPQFKRMREAGFQTLTVPFDKGDRVNKAGNLKLIFYFFIWVVPLAFRLKSLMKKEKISLVHVNTNIILGLPMIVAARLSKIPVVCHIRETRSLIKREKLFTSWVHHFFALNHTALAMYAEDIPPPKISVLYDGIDLEEFENVDGQKIRQEFGLMNAPVVATLGRLMRSKGQKEFVQAAAQALSRIPEALFLVVGAAQPQDLSFEEELHRYVKEAKLDGRIILTGWRTDVKEILAATDIFVFPTTTFPEGLPNAILEAMALSKPVIVTDIPGPQEIVKEGVSGYIVPPFDIAQMADHMCALLEDPQKCLDMGKIGRQRVENLFNVEKVALLLEEKYASILKGNNA